LGKALIIIFIIAILIGFDFLIAAGIMKLISWCFGFAFSWKYALGAWLCLLLIQAYFGKSKEGK
jgi:hypothetical protein